MSSESRELDRSIPSESSPRLLINLYIPNPAPVSNKGVIAPAAAASASVFVVVSATTGSPPSSALALNSQVHWCETALQCSCRTSTTYFISTLSQTLLFTCLQCKSFENEQFLFFPQCLLPFRRSFLPF